MNQVRDVDRKYPNEAVLSATEQTTVYRSVDQSTGAPVVVKLIMTGGQPDERVQSRRFLKVAGTVQTLGLKGLPRVIDFGIADERTAFLVMEPVEGEALFDCLGSPPDRMLGLLAQIVDTVEALSRSGVCHQNLTPKNILVPTGGADDEIRLLGLGTAAYLERFKGSTNPDDEGASRYIAPERLLPGSHNVAEDWRADLFSVALIAAVMLEADIKGVGGAHPSVVLPTPVRAALVDPSKLGGILETALRADPRQRKIGWSDLHDALRFQTPEFPDLGATMAIPLDRLPQLGVLRVDESPNGDDDSVESAKPPVAADDEYATDQDVVLSISAPGVLGNDSDADGRDLTAAVVDGPTSGGLKLEADGSFAYQPKPGFFGVDSFTYRAGNGELESDPATVTITINEVKKPPVAVDDEYATAQDEVLKVTAPGVLDNDFDHGHDTIEAVLINGSMSGRLTLEKDGSFIYVPKTGFHGEDSFTYKARGGGVDSETALVSITVLEIVAPPDKAGEPSITDDREDEPVPPPRPSESTVRPEPSPPPAPEPVPPPLPEAAIVPPPLPQPEAKTAPPPLPDPPPTQERPPDIPKIEPTGSPQPDEPGRRLSLPELSRRNMAILAGILAVILVILAVVFWPASTRETPLPTPAATPLPTAIPTRTPVPFEAPPTISVSLENAQNALIEGETETARSELAAITEEEIAVFSEEERALYDELTLALEGGDFDRAVKDLRGGMWWSSIKMLRRAVTELDELGAEEVAQVPGLDADLERAREALRLHALMYEAHDEAGTVMVLEHASALIAILPDFSRALVWREEAAAALEAEADADASTGNFDEALVVIEQICDLCPVSLG